MIDILAIGAHPDDLEFGCGGILAVLASQGRSIVLADLTLGDRGTHGTPEIRRKEAEAAAQIIGAERVFLNFHDCEIIDSFEGRQKLVDLIRHFKPKLILAPFWKGECSHPDHLGTGLMARYASRYARFAKILPNIATHTPQGILHYYIHRHESVDFLIDVSDHVQTWTKMMHCHTSQMKNFNYVDFNLRQAAYLGVLMNRPYAQALAKGNPIVIKDLLDIAQGTIEI